ncbi:acyl-CoA Delta-9 desaturase [Periplaneta americana]|uniref:acyl-CoA Delta-9 desaturase n=1 Tax=Periplaneta americana TaxID=6978 RepID=UPI0037E9C928
MSTEEDKKVTNADTGNEPRVSSASLDIHWPLVLYYVHFHLGAIFGLYHVFTEARILTTLFAIFIGLLTVLSATAGAHRLWAHRSYKANESLRIFLMICHTMLGQCTIYDWVLDHRVHHKYFGTDIDPYNKKRGFFYAHFISNLRKQHPDFKKYAATIDMSDIEADRIVMFQKRYYWLLMPVLFILLPWNAPVEYWNESIMTSMLVAILLRCTIAIECSMLINTAIHVWNIGEEGKAKDDGNLQFFVTKSYWPEYHYMVPWDYKTGEFGNYGEGCTSAFIRMWAALGWATDLKTLDVSSIKNVLVKAIDTKKPVVEYLQDEENFSKAYNEEEQYLRPFK